MKFLIYDYNIYSVYSTVMYSMTRAMSGAKGYIDTIDSNLHAVRKHPQNVYDFSEFTNSKYDVYIRLRVPETIQNYQIVEADSEGQFQDYWDRLLLFSTIPSLKYERIINGSLRDKTVSWIIDFYGNKLSVLIDNNATVSKDYLVDLLHDLINSPIRLIMDIENIWCESSLIEFKRVIKKFVSKSVFTKDNLADFINSCELYKEHINSIYDKTQSIEIILRLSIDTDDIEGYMKCFK